MESHYWFFVAIFAFLRGVLFVVLQVDRQVCQVEIRSAKLSELANFVKFVINMLKIHTNIWLCVGSEVSVDITYEPTAIGDVRSELVLSASDGQTHRCLLHGHCEPPRPQGPFTIKNGGAFAK